MRVLCALSLALFGSAASMDYTFDRYVVDYGKKYSDDELSIRQAVFEKNLKKIHEHNARGLSWTMGVNKHADLTKEEFLALKSGGYNKYLGAQQPSSVGYTPLMATKALSASALPTSVDWRNKLVVTPPKDQGGCGSCWTFGSTETTESHYALKTGKLLTLSEQEIVSCALNPDHCGGTGGCQGSTSELAFEYMVKHGQSLESVYPYESGTTGYNGKCDTTKPARVNVSSYVKLPANNFTAVINAIATVGPLAVSVDASEWQLYDNGVFTPYDGYTSLDIDHVVQMVGYGVDPDKGAYWLIRNSWGEVWGEQGYIRLARNDGSSKYCGTDTKPQDGTACKDGPKQITGCGTCGVLYDVAYPIIA